ncbi:phospholipid-transporting ATPase VD [Anabrus simplex]|uniref:phospholipid-transporting ATPase VD n=1 Tax=Anabrus simplex TaxID=316456 RepID=UPI0035A382FB
MPTVGSGENSQPQQEESQQCAIYVFPPTAVPPSSSGDVSSTTRGSVSAPGPASAMKGHARSASHGGIGAKPVASASSAGVVGRPSALKQNRGHQRALSQGQIEDSSNSVGFQRGHARVGSKTDFILPPGHKESDSGVGVTSSATKVHGHSRQASRSESIYTLRQSGTRSLWTQFKKYVLRHGDKPDSEEPRYRTVVPNHLVPPHTPKKSHPNGRRPDNRIRTTKYTLLSFLPKNLLEQFHRVANLYFIFIVLLNWFPAINAFGKEIAMIPVIFVLGVTAVKDLFEDRRRHASDKRINNSTCRVYNGQAERYKRVLWKDVRVGDLVHLSNNEQIPADVLLLRSSDPHGLCYIDTCNLDGETNLKQRCVVKGFVERQNSFQPSLFRSVVEVDPPTTKIYRFHGAIVHPSGERIPVSTDNLLLRECMLKNTDFVEGIVVYAGHETKAMLNNGGPRYKRSSLERQMNLDVIWCVLILVVLCVIGAVGCKLWLSSYDPSAPFIPDFQEPAYEGLLSFWTFVIILQVMIPLSLYVTMEMSKLMQVYHIHNDINLYDPESNKRIECRALNIPEELGQVQYIFSDKTGTLTENKMIFRRCTINGVDYNHATPDNLQNVQVGLNTFVPLSVNTRLREDMQNPCSSQHIQEFLVLMAVCNTVVVSCHPHHDEMNASGIIETSPSLLTESHINPDTLLTGTPHTNTRSSTLRGPHSITLGSAKPDKYSRLSESRSVTPSPPLLHGSSVHSPQPYQRPQLSPILSSTETTSPPDSPPVSRPRLPRPRMLNVPSILRGANHRKGSSPQHHPHQRQQKSVTPSPRELKPFYEAESPDELALVNAAYSYNCKLIKRTPQHATLSLPGGSLMELEILHVLPFDSSRKCMSVLVQHPLTNEKILYCKGADSTILSQLAQTDDPATQQLVFRTQQHLNSYARQGLRVLVMAKRVLSDLDYNDWLRRHCEAELAQENREKRIRESFARLETNLTLIGATGIEDRLQDGVPETIAALISAGIVVWVLTGDKPETAINVAYSARLFSPQMELLKLSARSKDAAERTIMFYLSEIQRDSPQDQSSGTTLVGPGLNQVGVYHRGAGDTPQLQHSGKKRALVVDGKTLTYILDRRSNLQKPFLELTRYCSSVLCCRSTPLQKAYIVKVVKEQLRMRTLAVGDGANDVSMIQTADVGIGISGREGRQAVMASDFAISRFKHLERFLLVHGHWCYDRLARMVLYFFYKNATFVFLIFWYQLYCGFSGSVMIDQMYLMLYNLLFTSLPPIVIGVYDQDVPEDLLLAQPLLYRQGRLGLVYQPHSFWLTMADSLYQSIVIFFISEAAYHDTDVGIWEFGMTVTTSCMFVMLFHVAIETRSWTVIHVLSILASISAFYIFSVIYNTVCLQCFGLPSNYYVVQQTIGSAIYWAVVVLSTVVALLPRFVWRSVETCLFPRDVTRAVLEKRRATRRGEDFLVSWSRSTSTSSIFRTTDYGPKDVNPRNLAVVG